jgi:hypothetical protein
MLPICPHLEGRKFMLRSIISSAVVLGSRARGFGGFAGVVALTVVVSGSASGQDAVPASLGITYASQSGGGGKSTSCQYVVEGASGQVCSGRMFGGSFEVTSGVMAGELPACQRSDYNLDGHVDGADLSVLLANWGDCPSGGSACVGDLNCDGMVDGADLSVLLAAWG